VLSLLIYLLKDVLESAVILLQDGVLGAEWKEECGIGHTQRTREGLKDTNGRARTDSASFCKLKVTVTMYSICHADTQR